MKDRKFIDRGLVLRHPDSLVQDKASQGTGLGLQGIKVGSQLVDIGGIKAIDKSPDFVYGGIDHLVF